jgi:pyruvyltransferase
MRGAIAEVIQVGFVTNLQRLALLPSKAFETAKLLAGNEAIVLRWATEGILARNWGDKLNPYLVERLSGRRVIHRSEVLPYPGLRIHHAIGSHLATACASPRSVVWGGGFISEMVRIPGRPREIHAVRGWLSVERLRKAGIECPDIVGDPALLLPRFYQPKPTGRRYELGVIAHCREWNEPFYRKARSWDDTLVIDICGDIEEVVDQIASCDRIVSSSLHGIICADSYGIPAIWLRASDKPSGDGFKFRDYFSSVGRPDQHPIPVNADTEREELLDKFFTYTIDIDLDSLERACPFRPMAA